MSVTGDTLNKRVAASGLCSRRNAVDFIKEGRISVNGEIVIEPGRRVTATDEVCLDGKALTTPGLTYILMNKPLGYVSTLSDPQNRPTVMRLLPKLDAVVKPVGRLDMNTEGLLIFTNDGLLAQRLAHPRYGIEKEYIALVEGYPDEKALKALREGIWMEGRKTSPATVEVDHTSSVHKESSLRMIIHEGRKRQIRMMCDLVGHPVKQLRRVRIGPIVLHKLPRGACRLLSKVEVDKLKKIVGLL
jgi:23S rRNA pseudouridine2605 synthase